MAFLPSLSVVTSVYRGESYLPEFFQNLHDQTIFPELELVLVLNEPSSIEKQLANDFQQRAPDQVSVVYAKKRETLGTSWNRAWKIARSPYLAFWNVDDRRIVDSLQRQLTRMEENPDWALCYGDYLAVPAYGIETGVQRYTPAYSPAHFKRSFAQGGAFWLLKKKISEILNYFDEQFSVAPDMEFSFRMATKKLEMGKCEGLLGYFTDAALGLSTSSGGQLSEVERTVIQMRYGVFDKVNHSLLKKVRDFRLAAIKSNSSWIEIASILPSLDSELRLRKPLWAVGYLRTLFRVTMKRIGLLGLFHKAQDKYLKREI